MQALNPINQMFRTLFLSFSIPARAVFLACELVSAEVCLVWMVCAQSDCVTALFVVRGLFRTGCPSSGKVADSMCDASHLHGFTYPPYPPYRRFCAGSLSFPQQGLSKRKAIHFYGAL